ncbi:hypothetical protein [Salsuginibacillus halophilus]|nr:hypothetical protein [Salsuginibacillus halophilus]
MKNREEFSEAAETVWTGGIKKRTYTGTAGLQTNGCMKKIVQFDTD